MPEIRIYLKLFGRHFPLEKYSHEYFITVFYIKPDASACCINFQP